MELFRPGNNTYFDVRPKPNVRLKPSDSSFYLNLSLEWTLTFEHPYDEEGRWKQIVGDSVILIESPFHLSKQAFVVDNIQKGLYSMTVECHHYFNESVNEQVIDRRAVDATPQEAMNKLFEGTEFNGEAEAGFIKLGTAYFIEGNVLSFIKGEDKDNTLASRWGGEFFYDNRTLKWYERLNKNKVFNITFSHNLTDIGLEEDWKGIYTRIYPKAYNGRKLSEPYYINSERIDDYPRVKSTWVTYDNIGLKEDYENFNEDSPPEGMTLYDTQQQLEAALHREVKNLFDTGIDLPKIAGTVNASILHNSLNRKGIIELPGLGYTVKVYNKLTNMEYQSRIIGIDWNTVKKCYNSIELGDPGDSSYFNQISSSMGNVDNIYKEIEDIKISDRTDWNQVIQDTKNELTEYINNGTYYGHVKVTPNELLILDDSDVDKAVKVWRWNMGGLGFSLNGYGGPYETAITAAGKMVINEATAETIKATMIKAGILASTDNSSWWNFDTGEFNWANGGITFDLEKGLKITVNGKTLDELLDENLVVSTNREHQIIVLDEDGTPSYDGNYEFKFTTYKMGTTTKVDSVIKSATPSDDNVSVTFDPAGTTINLVIDTNRQFTAMEGYVDVVVETKYHDVEKRITWSAITDVVDASFVRILPSSNIFSMKYSDSSYSPSQITLTPLLSRCEFSSWSYSYDGETWSTITSGSDGLTINNGKLIISNSSGIFTEENNSVAFKVNCTEEVSDVTTIVRVRDGVQGNDSVVVQLDNENHNFLGNQAGQAIASTIDVNIYGYSGVIQKPTTVGTINSPTGMTITISGNNTTNNKIEISVDSNLTSSGVVNIPITCMGITYNKVFSYNLSLPGIDGEGARSISIQPSSMAFKYNTNSDDYSPSTIKLKYTLIDETFNKWQYSTNGGSTWSDVVSGSNGLTINSDKTLTIASTADVFDHNGSLDVAVFKAWGVNGSEDIVTLARLRDGERGPQGIPGTSGSTYYTWIRYADDINGNGISNTPDGKEYIGFAYNKTTKTESNNPSDYKWSLIKGTDGIPGEKGKDGKTYYTWIKYSDNEDGSNMYDIPTTNTKYIGIANNKLTSKEGTDPSEYTWSKFRGDDGVPGEPGKDGVTYYTWIRYADDANGSGISNNPSGKTYIGLAYNKTTPTESNKASDYKWSLITGKDGLPGEKGEDGTTYYTWIAYSDNPNGSPMYQTPTEKTKYIGIATNQLTSVEGTDPSVYTWSQFRGNDGATPNFNLVTNSAFIDGSTGWLFRNAELDPNKNKNGHPCYKASYSGATSYIWSGGWTYGVPSNPTSYKAGDTITYSCYYYIEDLSTFDIGISLKIKGTPEGITTEESVISSVRPPLDQLVVGAWTRLYKTVTLEKNWDKCHIRCDVIQNGTAWFTDFKMELGSNVTPWLPTVAELEGPQGVEGPAGKDGKTYYTWIKYADDIKGTGISNDPTGKTYIGFAYNKTTSVESNTPSDYTWSLIKGTDGIPGEKGKDGKTYYTWIKYSDNSDGTGMYDTPKDTTKYIGIAVNQTTSTESTDKTKYTWSLFRGNDGKGISGVVNYYLATSSKSGVTTSTSGWSTDIPTMTSTKKYLWNYEEITYTDGSKSTTVPLIIGVYGDKGATGSAGKGIKSITEYYLATSSKSGVTTSTEGWGTTIPTITSTNKYLWNYEVIAYTDDTSTTTDPKIIGAYGDKGSTGTSATNVILGNESHTFAAQSNGQAVAATTNTTVIGYLGATQKACTIGTISGLPTGMTATIKNNDTTNASIDIAVTSSMTTKQGTLTIPVTCNKITFNKIFSYSLSLDGTPAPSARIVASSNSFLSSDGGKTYSPESITLSFSLIECNFKEWRYLDLTTKSWKVVTSGSNGFTINTNNTLSITVASALFGSLSGTINLKLVTSNSKAYDVITINKLVQVEDIGTQLSDIKSEITQTNNAWKAAFTTGNANNLLYDGDFKLGTDNWIAEDGATITTGNSSVFPFYDNEKFMKIVCPGAARYKYDLELKPDTDYVYEAWVYIYSANTVTGERCPLDFWLWTGDIPLDKRSSLCEIKEYNNSRVSKKCAHLYVHFKTTNSPTTVVSWRGFISAYTPTSGTPWLGVREVSLREASMPGAWQPNANEVVTGSTVINQNGIKVEHSESGTYTQMDSQGFSIRDSATGDVFTWLSSKEQWTELKVDKVFANNLENIYEGPGNLYVDHSEKLAGDGSADKPFNSFKQLAEYLQATPVINKDVYITVRDPGFIINEQLRFDRLKGTGFIKITLEGKLVIANVGSGQFCMEFHQIPKWVWIVSERDFGSSTTGALLQDGGNGDGHGIYATDVDRLEIDSLTIACKNYGILSERSYVYTWHVDFGKCYNAIELRYQSIYYSSDDVGSCTDFVRLKSGSFAYWGPGTVRPQGYIQATNGVFYSSNNNLVPTASPRYPTSNPTPPPTSGQIYTYTYDWTSHKTYQYQWSNWGDSDCKQGSWGYGLRGGHMFFDISTLRSQMAGTVQDGNTITLTRAGSGGLSGPANVYINGSTCSSASGTPSYGGQVLLGTLSWSETKTFTLPKAIVQGLVSGSYNSLAVYVNSSANDCYLNIVNCSITLKTKK